MLISQVNPEFIADFINILLVRGLTKDPSALSHIMKPEINIILGKTSYGLRVYTLQY